MIEQKPKQNKWLRVPVLFCLVWLAACQSRPVVLRDYILKHVPAKVLGNYQIPPPESSLVSRIRSAPDFLISYLQAMDQTDTYKPYLPDEKETELIAAYLEALPLAFREAMHERLLGIYFIENFAGGGMADYVIQDAGQELFFTLILNPETLRQPLSTWIAYRDNSAFLPGPFRVANTLGESEKGLLHSLSHEAAHIYDYTHRFIPYTEPSLLELGHTSLNETPYTAAVWQSYKQPYATHDFAQRSTLKNYGLGKALPNIDMPELYRTWAASPFASLYGSSNWAEDFAEMAAWLHIRKRYGLEYRVQIFLDDERTAEYSPLDTMALPERQILLADVLAL